MFFLLFSDCAGPPAHLEPHKWYWVTGERLAFPNRYWIEPGYYRPAARSVSLSKSARTGEIFFTTWVADSVEFPYICQFWTPLRK